MGYLEMLEPDQTVYREPEQTVPSIPLEKLPGLLPTEEEFIARDRRTCDCELTYVHRKRHAALGVGIEIKLCCLAKFIEKQFGLPAGTFFVAMDFEPSWEWDCHKVHLKDHHQPDGSVITVEHQQGPPPPWLLKRFKEKGIKVKNLPPHLED